MENIFFFQTQQIPDSSSIFDQFKQQKIFYSYFQVDQNYYLFLYAQKSIQIDFLYQEIDVIQELDSKQRKIRSFRGFFLYALEIIENGKDHEILSTNLQPFFWKKIQDVIRQNKKAALQEFLFGSDHGRGTSSTSSSLQLQEMQDKIQSLQKQVESLKDRIRDLETTQDNFKYPLTPPEPRKILQQGDSTPKLNMGSYFHKNDNKFSQQSEPSEQEAQEIRNEISESFSEASKSPLKASERSEHYNLSSNRNTTQNGPIFVTLGTIPEQERIEIIKTGFRLNQEGKISLKKYYESKDPNSLFQLKGYSIKYETIRRTKLYQNLKE